MPSQTQTKRIELDDGRSAGVRPVKRVGRDVTRVQVTGPTGEQWRLDVDRDGIADVVTTRNANGELADVPLPEWIDQVIARLP